MFSSNIYFKIQPRITTKEIQSVYTELLKNNEDLQLRPAYQRSLCWTQEQKTNLIDSIMSGCPMPIFLLYSFEMLNECIDGQHRLTTIKTYMEQTYSSDDKPFPWKLYSNDKTEYVFYDDRHEAMKIYIEEQNKKTRYTSKKKTFRFMTSEERSRYKTYEIAIQKITTELSFEQRKEIFLRWQSGTGITQCEKFKNENYSFCEFIIKNNLQNTVSKNLSEFLKSDTKNWLWDLYRMLLLFSSLTNEPKYSMISSLEARTHIQKPSQPYDISDEKYNESIQRLTNYLTKVYFLKEFKNKMKLSLFMIIAYLWFKNNSENSMNDPDFMKEFINEIINDTNYKCSTLNNGPEIKICLTNLINIEEKLKEKLLQKKKPIVVSQLKKKKINDSLKTSVWNKYFGSSVGETDCFCCGSTKINQRDFHAGHVLAEATGGETNLENLRPICSKCNQSMGIEDMRLFMKKNYPMRNFK